MCFKNWRNWMFKFLSSLQLVIKTIHLWTLCIIRLIHLKNSLLLLYYYYYYYFEKSFTEFSSPNRFLQILDFFSLLEDLFPRLLLLIHQRFLQLILIPLILAFVNANINFLSLLFLWLVTYNLPFWNLPRKKLSIPITAVLRLLFRLLFIIILGC